VHQGCETSMQYFSRSGGTSTDSTKAPRHVMSNVCFCIQWDLWVTSCIPMRLGSETMMDYFSRSGAPGAVSIKSAPGNVTRNFCFFASGGKCRSRSAF
jgi:hypothetical protein